MEMQCVLCDVENAFLYLLTEVSDFKALTIHVQGWQTELNHSFMSWSVWWAGLTAYSGSAAI
jgi:hypothetical protein